MKTTRGGARPNSGPKPTVRDGKRYTVYLSVPDVERIKAIERPLSEFIREAITEELERERLTLT